MSDLDQKITATHTHTHTHTLFFFLIIKRFFCTTSSSFKIVPLCFCVCVVYVCVYFTSDQFQVCTLWVRTILFFRDSEKVWMFLKVKMFWGYIVDSRASGTFLGSGNILSKWGHFGKRTFLESEDMFRERQYFGILSILKSDDISSKVRTFAENEDIFGLGQRSKQDEVIIPTLSPWELLGFLGIFMLDDSSVHNTREVTRGCWGGGSNPYLFFEEKELTPVQLYNVSPIDRW